MNLSRKIANKINPQFYKFACRFKSDYPLPANIFREVTDSIYPKIRKLKKEINPDEIVSTYKHIYNLFQNKNYEEAFTQSNIFLNDCLFINDKEMLFNIYSLMADIQLQRQDYESAADKFTQAFQHFSAIENKDEKLIQDSKIGLINLSLCYELIKDHKKASETIQTLLEKEYFNLSEKDPFTYINGLYNLAKNKALNKEYKEALDVYHKIIGKLEHFNKDITDEEQINFLTAMASQTYYEIANNLSQEENPQRDYSKIVNLYQKSYQIIKEVAPEITNPEFIFELLFKMALNYNLLKDYPQSINLLLQCEQLLQANNSSKLEQIYNLLSENYLGIQNFTFFIEYSVKEIEMKQKCLNFNLEENAEAKEKLITKCEKVLLLSLECWENLSEAIRSNIYSLLLFSLQIDLIPSELNEEKMKSKYNQNAEFIDKFSKLIDNNDLNIKLQKIIVEMKVITLLYNKVNVNINEDIKQYLH